MERLIALGRWIFAVALIALGAENVICAWLRLYTKQVYDGQTVLAVIPWVPAHAFWGYLMGTILLASGLAIFTGIQARLMSVVLGSWFLLFVLLHSNAIIASRTAAFEMLFLSGSAFRLTATLPGEVLVSERRNLLLEVLTKSSRYFLAISCIVFGIDHFILLRFVASLIPSWIPFHLLWAAFTGACFLAAGLSFATRWLARWAGFWLGVMFLLWFVLLHMPRVLGLAGIVGAPHNPNEWSSALIALAIGGGAWILAHSLSAEPIFERQAAELPVRLES